MDLTSLPLTSWLFDGAYGLLMGLADILAPFLGATSAAAAIILITLVVRAALIPTAISMQRGMQSRARLAPKMQELQKKHKNNPERLQREMMQLYSDEGTSPFAGCLPMLVQAPVVGIIYALFIHPQINGHANDLLTHTFAGVPLGSSLAGEIAAGTLTWPTALVFGGIVVAIAAVGEITRRVFRPKVPATADASAASKNVAKTDAAPNPAAALQSPTVLKMLGFLQFITAVFACFVPLAAGLYLFTTVTWTLVQRIILQRRFPMPEPVAA
ncbi:YidC/Oxa1 family membrane protein insertase [Agromyces protaetiae]|uniref:Membrane protein insertase YidC n=1 Tax=Agromyces protaetiae TaxID=2509455 RepID=A0A4P6FGV6_9MICO|nr:membrane protein insertase YidC [Agromyces protaetiae]QAY73107.1 YidC/Oxa1 family membrane protein insertase [Agromyces protaetiae]